MLGEANEADIAFGIIVREGIRPELIYSQDIEVWKHFDGTYMGVVHSDMDLPRVIQIIQGHDPGEYREWATSEIEDQRWVTFVKEAA